MQLAPFADRFGFFDPKMPCTVTWGELPHWEQEGATYFITFRTVDSLPTSVADTLVRQRDDWLRRQEIDPDKADWQTVLKSRPQELQLKFHRILTTQYEAALDKGYGECLLRDRRYAKVVANSLLHFDGVHLAELFNVDELLRNSVQSWGAMQSCGATLPQVRYHISDFVIMPNHVHVMVCLLPGVRLRAQCKSWKHYSATQINQILGTTGEFWQSESFDHLVRDADHFNRFRKYIAENPTKAGLRQEDCIHHFCIK